MSFTELNALFKEVYSDKMGALISSGLSFAGLSQAPGVYLNYNDNQRTLLNKIWHDVNFNMVNYATSIPIDLLKVMVDAEDKTHHTLFNKIYLKRTTKLGKIIYGEK